METHDVTHRNVSRWAAPLDRRAGGSRRPRGFAHSARSTINLRPGERELIDAARGEEPLSSFVRRASLELAQRAATAVATSAPSAPTDVATG